MLITDIQDIKGILAGISTPTGGSGFLFPRNPHQPLDAWFQCSTAFPSGPNHFLKYLYILYDHGPWKSQKYLCKYDISIYIYHIISVFLLVQPTFFCFAAVFPHLCHSDHSKMSIDPIRSPQIDPRSRGKKNMIQGLGLEGFPLHNLYIVFFLTLQNWGGETCR